MRLNNIYSCCIIANKSEQLEQIADHLRYWPFVKYYCFLDEQYIMIGVRLGETRKHNEHVQLYKSARELIKLCLRQYEVDLTPWECDPKGFIPSYSDDLFLRPSATLKPFSEFISKLHQSKIH